MRPSLPDIHCSITSIRSNVSSITLSVSKPSLSLSIKSLTLICAVQGKVRQCHVKCYTILATLPSLHLKGAVKTPGDSRRIKQHTAGFYAGHHLIAIITSLCGNRLLSAQCYQQQYFALLCNHKLMRQHKI